MASSLIQLTGPPDIVRTTLPFPYPDAPPPATACSLSRPSCPATNMTQLNDCKQRNCQDALRNLQLHLQQQVFWSPVSTAAQQVRQCEMQYCTTEFIAAHAVQCVGVYDLVTRRLAATTVSGPPIPDLDRLNNDIKSNQTLTASNYTVGVCLLTQPLGAPCDPANAESIPFIPNMSGDDVPSQNSDHGNFALVTCAANKTYAQLALEGASCSLPPDCMLGTCAPTFTSADQNVCTTQEYISAGGRSSPSTLAYYIITIVASIVVATVSLIFLTRCFLRRKRIKSTLQRELFLDPADGRMLDDFQGTNDTLPTYNVAAGSEGLDNARPTILQTRMYANRVAALAGQTAVVSPAPSSGTPSFPLPAYDEAVAATTSAAHPAAPSLNPPQDVDLGEPRL
ncbi:hypothetical protein RI367_000140 [Sorochytrium milnesiophthora]